MKEVLRLFFEELLNCVLTLRRLRIFKAFLSWLLL